jgi:hypothetical protein
MGSFVFPPPVTFPALGETGRESPQRVTSSTNLEPVPSKRGLRLKYLDARMKWNRQLPKPAKVGWDGLQDMNDPGATYDTTDVWPRYDV